MNIGSHFAVDNIFQASIPFNYLAKAFGLASYCVTNWGCEVKTSTFDFVILTLTILFWTCIMAYHIYVSFVAASTNLFHDSNFLNQVQEITFTFQVILSLFLFIYNHIRRHHIQKMLKSFDDFDKKLNELKNKNLKGIKAFKANFLRK